MEQVTFIMQGPLTADSIRSIKILKKFGKTVVSCWNTDPPPLIQAAASSCDEIVVNPFIEETGYNFQNISYQISSSLSGLEKCSTDLAVKVRSDEYFTDCEEILRLVRNYRDKLTVCNFLFRKGVLLHPSDHILGSTKESLIEMFETSKDLIKDFKHNQRIKMSDMGLEDSFCFRFLTAESTFCLSWLKIKGIDFIKEVESMPTTEVEGYYRKLLKKHYCLVRASDLGHFLFRFKSNANIAKPTAYTDEQQFLCLSERLACITSFDDIQITSLRELEYED